jgi:hypothetical protein
MTIEEVPAPAIPDDQRQLLDTYRHLIREAVTLAGRAGKTTNASPANFIVFVLFGRLVQLARTIRIVSLLGYAHEAQALARTSLNVMTDLLFIRQAEPDRRALLHALYSQKRRRIAEKGRVKHGFLSQADYDRWDADQTRKEEESLQHSSKGKLEPAEKIGDGPTWTGLKDFEIFRLVGRGDFYDLFYVPFSDAVHGNIMGARQEVIQAKTGLISVGPRFPGRILGWVVQASADALIVGLRQVDQQFALTVETKIDPLQREVLDALNLYAASKSFRDDAFV